MIPNLPQCSKQSFLKRILLMLMVCKGFCSQASTDQWISGVLPFKPFPHDPTEASFGQQSREPEFIPDQSQAGSLTFNASSPTFNPFPTVPTEASCEQQSRQPEATPRSMDRWRALSLTFNPFAPVHTEASRHQQSGNLLVRNL